MASTPELVDYAYIAEQLKVNVQTIRKYATSKKGRQQIDYFPESVAPETSRSPLFRKDEADAFIERRIAESKLPGHMNVNKPGARPTQPASTRAGISAAAQQALAKSRGTAPGE